MKPEETPCSILRRIDISSSRCLRDEGTVHTEAYPLLGGIFSDTKLAWFSRGPILEVVNTKDGSVMARWTFGAVIKDLSTKVTCVEEYKHPVLNRMSQPLLQSLVGLECELTGGMVCVFNFTGPRVLRAINIPSKVTSMALISRGMEVTSLHSSLEMMDGIVGVGTKDGHVFLLDLRRTDCQHDLSTGSASHWENLRDELSPCQLIPVRGGGVEQRIKEFPNDHLCLHLNHSAFSHFKRFVVQFPRGDYKQYLPEDSSVTSMLYVPGLSSLIVGFAFGSFQIWSLKTLNLLYTCPMGGGPVERLQFQEPCDDPNACCYLWVVRGTTADGSNDSGSIPTVIMYTLCYDEKLWVHECGNVFNNFTSCNIAFKFEFDQDEEIVGGRVIGLRTIDQSLRPASLPDDNTLGSSTSSLSLCLLVWETWGTFGPQDGLDATNTHMAVFDLNHWYVEHMPSRLSSRGGVSRNKSIAGYVAKYRLGETLCGDDADGSTFGTLLDVNIDPTSLLPFTTVQNVEEHSRPSALQFRSVAFLEKQVVHVNHPGIQRALLATLTSTGPSLLLTPTYVFHQCLALGLRPLQYDMPDSVNVGLVGQRSYVILVALEHRLTRWLSACARECSDGRMDGAGCTLAWFLDVLWSRLDDLKRAAVELCVELFDLSGEILDANASRLLRHIVGILRVLKSLFDNVTKEGWHLRLMDSHHIELQNQALHLEVEYYDVLQWFIGAGLLPELPENSSQPENGHVPYPAKNLVEVYTSRRTELQELYKSYEELEESEDLRDDGVRMPPQDLLMIDGLISHQAGGKRLQSEWERDAGSAGGRFANMYPPASVQGLLRTYLVRDISYDIKTSIVTYVFMDLAATLDSDKCASNLHRFMQFPSAFNMSPGQIKVTQAFWHLDHRSFDVALEMLLDPLVSYLDVEVWQHRSVVRALMLQGQHRLALRYWSAREPPLNTDHDIRLKLNLLLANDLVHEAFMFQRDYRSFENSQSLLEHFFKGCEKRQLLSAILQLTLTEEEERAFVSFLASNENVLSGDLHVMYLLKRFRYVEAFDVNQRLRKTALESGRAVGSFEDEEGSTRDIVVNALYKTLPSVTRSLAAHCAQQRNKACTWKQVKRPRPLSVDVRHCNAEVKYKSPFIETALAKIRETWSKVLPQMPPDSDSKLLVERTPFLCTPRAKLFSLTKTIEKPRSLKMSDIWSRKRPRDEEAELSGLPATKLSRSVDRPSISHHNIDADVNDSTGVLTPIVKRQSPNSRFKARLSKSGDISKSTVIPHSIIKSRDSFALKSPLRIPSEGSTSSRTSNRSQYNSMAKSLLAAPDTPEQSRSLSARRPPLFKLDVELTDDDEDDADSSAKDDESGKKSVISDDESVGHSVISNDVESEDDVNGRQIIMDSFALPSTSPSPVRTPGQKRVSLSNMVVLSEARKANLLANTPRWSVQANRSSVTFGDNSVCVYDKDEPASTATGSSELSKEADEDSLEVEFNEDSQEKEFDDVLHVNELDEDSREKAFSEDSREQEFAEDSRDKDFEYHSTEDVHGNSASDDEGDRIISLAALQRRCHERVQPRSSIADILNRSFEQTPVPDLRKFCVEGSAQEESADRNEEPEVIDAENDFHSSPVQGTSTVQADFAVTPPASQEDVEKDEQDEVVELTDDDSNDRQEKPDQQQDSSPAKVQEDPIEEVKKEEAAKQEGSLLFSVRCALLSPSFRNRLARKTYNEPTKESPPQELVQTPPEGPVDFLPEKVFDIEPEKVPDSEPEKVSDSEDVGEVSGDVAADSLISNDLDSEEEVQEQLPAASKFWSFLLPLKTPSPVRTPEKQPSLSNMVLLSEARKRCHARVKPRPSTHPEVLDKLYAEDDVNLEPEDTDHGPSTSTPKREQKSKETVEEVSIHRSVHTANSDFESVEMISIKTTTSSNFASIESTEPDPPKSKDIEVSDDDSNDVLLEGMQAKTTELVSPGKASDRYAQLVDAILSETSEVETENVVEMEQDTEDRDAVMEQDEMEELRVEDSEDEKSIKKHESEKPSIVLQGAEPCTPPDVAPFMVMSTALRTPRSSQLTTNRVGETPRSEKKSLRRTRLTESASFSGVKTRGAAKDPGSTPGRGASQVSSESSKSSPTKVSPQEGHSPLKTRSSGPVEEVEEVTSARKARGANVVKESEVEEGTPRRKRGSSVSKDEVQEGTPRRTRGASVAKDAEIQEGTPRRTKGPSVASEDLKEGTPRRTRGGSVAKDAEVREETPHRTRHVSVAKEDLQEGTPRRARGGSVAKDAEVQEETPRRTKGASVAKDEVQEGTPRRTRGGSVAKDVEVQEETPRRTRGASVAKEELQEGTTRRTRGSSVAKDVEVQEETPRRTRGASVAEEELQEGTPGRTRGGSITKDTEGIPRRTRGSSVAKDADVPENVSRRTRGSSVEVQEGTPRRTRALSVLKEVDDELTGVTTSSSLSSSVIKELQESSSTPRHTTSSSILKEVEEEAVTPRATRNSRSLVEEDKTSTPRRTRSSSVVKETEPTSKLDTPKPEVTEPTPEKHSASSSKDGTEPKTRRRGRGTSVAKEVESPSRRETRSSSSVHESSHQTGTSSELKEEPTSLTVTSHQTQSSSMISEREEHSPPRLTRSSDKSPPKKKADDETSSVSGKRGRRSERGKTSELESSFESKDGDTESNYSRRSKASQANSPDSIASRVRARLASVSSAESSRKPSSKSKTESLKKKSAESTNDSSLILQKKLAQISDSEESARGTPLKKARLEVPRREGSVAKSTHSDVTERLYSESGSECAHSSSMMNVAKPDLDLSSRDRIEAAIQEYSSTRRLTRKQQALLSRSLEICAQPERFQKTAVSTVSDVEEDEEDHADTQSQSSVRSSVRLRKKRESERQVSPSSTATTEILSGKEQADTPTRRATKRMSGSQGGSPSSVVSGASGISATRGRRRLTAARRKAVLKEVEEESAVAVTASTEIETSSQASSRKNVRELRKQSVTPDFEAHVFAEPQSPESDVGSLSDVSAYRESFHFSPPQNVEVQGDFEVAAPPRRTRQSKVASQPPLGSIREESQSSTVEDDSSSTKSSNHDKRRSWHLFTPLTERELAAAAGKKKRKRKLKQQKPIGTSEFSRRSRSGVFNLLLKETEESDD